MYKKCINILLNSNMNEKVDSGEFHYNTEDRRRMEMNETKSGIKCR